MIRLCAVLLSLSGVLLLGLGTFAQANSFDCDEATSSVCAQTLQPVAPAASATSASAPNSPGSLGPAASTAAKSRPVATATLPAADPHAMRPAKIALLVMAILLVVCIWLHSRGSMTIYSCYTDALWTAMTPLLAGVAYLIAGPWLELPTPTAQIAAAAVFGLMLVQVVIQTLRHNGFSLFFVLALYAKLVLFTLYFLCMAVLIFGGGRTAVQRRRQRNLALGGSVLFALLTGWMTRNRRFSHIDDYLAGRS